MLNDIDELKQTRDALEKMIEAIDAAIEIRIKAENGEDIPDDVVDSVLGKMLRAGIELKNVTV